MESARAGHPLFRQQAERGERFHVKASARLQTETRLVISQREIHGRTVKSVDRFAIIPEPPQDHLRARDDVLLDLWWRGFVRRPTENTPALEARWRRWFRPGFVVVVGLLLRRCPRSWRRRLGRPIPWR